jgi:hypothetical protein
MDLVGPIKPSSVSDLSYFLTIVDQFSSFKFVRFLKAKSDTLDLFKIFLKEVKTLKILVSRRFYMIMVASLLAVLLKISLKARASNTFSHLLKLLNITDVRSPRITLSQGLRIDAN